MWRLQDIQKRVAEGGSSFSANVDSQESDDRSESAVLREIGWTLGGWISFVGFVQLALALCLPLDTQS